jgi:hypothetical protein
MALNLNWRLWLLRIRNGAGKPFRDASKTMTSVANEELFNSMLSLERKRTERTGDPFVLMILDISLLNGNALHRKIGETCGAIRAATRDTDVHGWYAFPLNPNGRAPSITCT